MSISIRSPLLAGVAMVLLVGTGSAVAVPQSAGFPAGQVGWGGRGEPSVVSALRPKVLPLAFRPPAGRPGVLPLARRAPAGFRWPLDAPVRLVGRFEPPLQRWLAGHRGVDLGATDGAVVRAAGPGVVVFAGPVAGRPVLSVQHADGLRTTYEPVDADVRAGDQVSAGTPVGRLRPGHAGCAGVCLHWGARRYGEYLDPLSLFGLGRIRLLPVVAATGG